MLRPTNLYPLLRSVLFSLDAEQAHDFSFKSLKLLAKSPLSFCLNQPIVDDPIQLFGLNFKNRVGLAAGLDKNGDYIDLLAKLGFASIEIGTVTPKAQVGNPKPRLFRIPEAEAIINRMGFNNNGVEQLLRNVKASSFVREGGIIGINIGKNANTAIEDAARDYLFCLRTVYSVASYITVNISSPNTKNLRDLQQADLLAQLLSSLKAEQIELANQHNRYAPILLKIAPDLTLEEISSIAELVVSQKFDGIIAGNTTLSRQGIEGYNHAGEAGGLSGRPLLNLANSTLDNLNKVLEGRCPIIGVGGIMSGADALSKIARGASMVQLYSGLIYRGPALVSECASTVKSRG